MSTTIDPRRSDQAECRNSDPELFFPLTFVGAKNNPQVKAARGVCGRCAIADPCLRWALDTGEPFGVLGGLTPPERRRLMQGAEVAA